jgi:hypothetical protein
MDLEQMMLACARRGYSVSLEYDRENDRPIEDFEDPWCVILSNSVKLGIFIQGHGESPTKAMQDAFSQLPDQS